MRKNQFEGLLRNLLHLLPGYSVSGWLLHRPAGHGTLCGFCCDPSGFDPERFALVAFALPLFVPLPGGLHLNFGRRLRDTNRREIWWNRLGQDIHSTLVSAVLRAEAEFFHRHRVDSDPSDLLRSLGNPSDPYLVEALAFCHARAGRTAAARHSLKTLTGSLDPAVPWHMAMAARLAVLDSLLDAPPGELQLRMNQWTETNRLNLQIP